ncbi:2-C-methyl-D-erythritol 2,4-cyclodiphosphate synthase [Candidatus Peregrinibacteria bacterium]|nr:2-C-methyl-D-erythritol 2,4-cyclodiphosphate synthase [Candidatus Peregrinibacteria bacterium]
MNVGLILAAGKGKRAGLDKLFCVIKGRPVICYSLDLFERSPLVDAVIVVSSKSNKRKIEQLIQDGRFKKIKTVCIGGDTRLKSVICGFSAAEKAKLNADYLIIHNAANPLASHEELKKCINACTGDLSGVAVGRPVASTVKITNDRGIVQTNVSRENLWEMETPQIVRFSAFKKALEQAKTVDVDYTDDLSVLEAAGMKTAVVLASAQNRKITTREDFAFLKSWAGDLPNDFCVGIGEDSHQFGEEGGWRRAKKCLVLGGVKIEDLPALDADSDGDVVIHALCNAISSAIGGGSLGTYATKMCKSGIKDSKLYLKKVLVQMVKRKMAIRQCSVSIEAARPKIDPLVPKIKKSLGKLLNSPEIKIGITATSGEKLTPFGKGEAIKCTAAVILHQHSNI